MSRLCIAFIIVLMALHNLVVAEHSVTNDNLPQGPRIEASPTSCETHIAILDIADQDAGQDGLIIIIGRLGNGERNRQLNQHRLHSARAYLTEYRAVRSPGTIIIAEGNLWPGTGELSCTLAGNCTALLQ